MECPFNEYYGSYLAVDGLLALQKPVSLKDGKVQAHDEMLFIIVHQTYELWFKQILHELRACCDVLGKPIADDNGVDMNVVVHRLRRIVEIWKLLNQQVDVLETMTPLDFLDFRSNSKARPVFKANNSARLNRRSACAWKIVSGPSTTNIPMLGGFNEQDYKEITERKRCRRCCKWSSNGSSARRSSTMHFGRIGGESEREPRFLATLSHALWREPFDAR